MGGRLAILNSGNKSQISGNARKTIRIGNIKAGTSEASLVKLAIVESITRSAMERIAGSPAVPISEAG